MHKKLKLNTEPHKYMNTIQYILSLPHKHANKQPHRQTHRHTHTHTHKQSDTKLNTWKHHT